jgi:hypothetical protein
VIQSEPLNIEKMAAGATQRSEAGDKDIYRPAKATDKMPPLVNQPTVNQATYCAQQVLVTAATVTNAPLVIPFQAMYDRAPSPDEIDVGVSAAAFSFR